MFRISQIYHPSENKYQSLKLLINEKIVKNQKFAEEIQTFEEYHKMYSDKSIKDFLRFQKETLDFIFKLFKTTDSADIEKVPKSLRSITKNNKVESVPRITLKRFINFLTTFRIVPTLISSLMASKLFRSVPSPLLFNDCLDYCEFTEACVYIALHVFQKEFSKDGFFDPLASVELWFKIFEYNPKIPIENLYSLRNSVYTLH